MGMSGTGYRMCARVVDSAAILFLPDTFPLVPTCDVYQQPDPDQLPEYLYTFDTSVFPGHFPFGFDVEPD